MCGAYISFCRGLVQWDSGTPSHPPFQQVVVWFTGVTGAVPLVPLVVRERGDGRERQGRQGRLRQGRQGGLAGKSTVLKISLERVSSLAAGRGDDGKMPTVWAVVGRAYIPTYVPTNWLTFI